MKLIFIILLGVAALNAQDKKKDDPNKLPSAAITHNHNGGARGRTRSPTSQSRIIKRPAAHNPVHRKNVLA